jgi:hypothetical protein
VFPPGFLKYEGLINLAKHYYQQITAHAIGEQKHLYQEILRLRDLGALLGSPRNCSQIESFNKQSTYSLHDILFLNDFLHWYLRPMIEEELQTEPLYLLYLLDWLSIPTDCFRMDCVNTIELKHFVDEGKPIEEFGYYLGLID